MWDSFWDFIWYTLVIFAFIAYLMILFSIITDLFWRDHKTSGVVKAIWVVFLIVFPYLTALVYLIARGKGMGERSRDAASPQRRTPRPISARPPGAHRRRRSPTPRRFSTRGPSASRSSTALKAKALG